ncbi:single-stranded-DNA-specific exonuclease RecJ [Paenibacillus cremeus]|uniref:Single-stranded-DNA-specific exonuclease RecJ n=1 Tax=Paenibacillus cremeus TaxID=2163881 RepID=A0A559KIJ1_9BACL|nr:single-stranded-DNA-specific exonuclease RecJ [Paenibacillus cremeus]TVY11941.1 single-stranded-DNA-specific exonuclease RecJ [Paenibacillus cremeus]
MLQAKSRWNIGEADAKQAADLAEALGLTPMLAKMLVIRGITDIEHAEKFLHGGTDQIHDPFLLDGMAASVERIRKAVDAGERIRIYGDYDADGVSSTTLMVRLLRQLDCTFDYYIPHRVHEGYGLNCPALDAAHAQGVTLLITVDTGISAIKEIEYAQSLGMDVIVTDHHEPPEVLPEAYAIINPKKPGCPYPFKPLAGVGVALKLAQALLGRWPEELLEIAAIGTVADLMPLTGENRMIVKMGLVQMRDTSNLGIKALLGVAGIAVREVNSTHIGFALAPRINASGRLLSADTAVKLLTTQHEQEAEQMAFELDQLNKERQKIVDEMTKQAIAMMEEQQREGGLPKTIVLAHEDWNVGVIGIVASKLVDRFYRPTIILGIDKETGMAKGSARSIAGFDMYRALTHCHDLMDHFGGHPMAAGMTLERQHLPELGRRLAALAEEWLAPDDFVPLLQADMMCEFEDVALETIRQLELLGPFGMGNPSPRFVLNGLKLKEMRTMGKEQQHLKLSLRSAASETAASVDAVGFSKGQLSEWISPSASVDVLGEFSINEWNGVRRPQIMIQDLRVPDVQLFDWRGTPKPEKKLAELCQRLERRAYGTDGTIPPAVVLFSAALPSALRSTTNAAVWHVDLLGELHPLNKLAAANRYSEAQDIVLYALPERLDQLDAAAAQAESVQRFYAAFGGTEEEKQASVMPSREMFKTVYGAVSVLQGGGSQSGFLSMLAKRSSLSPGLVRFILDVFTEIGLMEPAGEAYRLVPASSKKDLSGSLLYQARMKRPEVEQELVYTSARELLLRLARAQNDGLQDLFMNSSGA